MQLRLALAQTEVRVGDIAGNVATILDQWQAAARQGADVVVFSELAVTGYPPEDLLLDDEFVTANLDALDRLASDGPAGTVAVVGYVGPGAGDATAPDQWDVPRSVRDLTNSAAVLADGQVVATYDKQRLPNYGVFDEYRYFAAGTGGPCIVTIRGVKVGVVICEDLWSEDGPAAATTGAGAQVLAVLNASPYHRGKYEERERWAAFHARRGDAHVAWVNVSGGQDEVVFDGDSLVVAPDGAVTTRAGQFVPDLVVVDLEVAPEGKAIAPAGGLPGAPDHPPLPTHQVAERLDPVGEVWHALVCAIRDYCRKNRFADAMVGLSGGIDSAVVAALAADALGGEHLVGVAMPSPYSSAHSLTDAEALAANLGCRYHELPIGPPLAATSEVLGDLVVTDFGRDDGRTPGIAYENIQARLRGLLLMALSNEHGAIVLTTGNKSEYAVGYSTLYGDMAGGFAPLKDVPKLLVYELARWRNREHEVIPSATITKPPSAELRPDQLDADSLPPYEVLDDIISAYVEFDLSPSQIAARGHDEQVVRRVVRMIDVSEYKRRQGAPGPKITRRAFGRERRMPITSLWRR